MSMLDGNKEPRQKNDWAQTTENIGCGVILAVMLLLVIFGASIITLIGDRQMSFEHKTEQNTSENMGWPKAIADIGCGCLVFIAFCLLFLSGTIISIIEAIKQ